ncbi:MAG: FkbM family methyltransferase, partial [Terriglobales bacterium]
MSLSPLARLRVLTWQRQRSRRREFRFRFGRRQGFIRVRVRARHSPFQAEFFLRSNASDLRTFQQIFLADFYNLAHFERWPELIEACAQRARRAPPLILDLGANIGLAAIYLAKLFPQARILAVEPDRDNFALLQRNLAPFPQVLPLLAAVASADGAARILDPDAPPDARRAGPAAVADADAVPAYSIASLLAMAAPAEPWLAKADIEGAEAALFDPGDWVAQFPILILE